MGHSHHNRWYCLMLSNHRDVSVCLIRDQMILTKSSNEITSFLASLYLVLEIITKNFPGVINKEIYT